MNEIPLNIEIFINFFGIFCIVSIPAVIIFFIISAFLDKRNPERVKQRSQESISKVGRITRPAAGFCMMLLSIVLLSWPVYGLFFLQDSKGLSGINWSENFLTIIFNFIQFLALPIILIIVGIFYIRTGLSGVREELDMGPKRVTDISIAGIVISLLAIAFCEVILTYTMSQYPTSYYLARLGATFIIAVAISSAYLKEDRPKILTSPTINEMRLKEWISKVRQFLIIWILLFVVDSIVTILLKSD